MVGDVRVVVGGDVERSLPPSYITADSLAIIVLTVPSVSLVLCVCVCDVTDVQSCGPQLPGAG